MTMREKHLLVLDGLKEQLLHYQYFKTEEFFGKTSPSHMANMIEKAQKDKTMPDDKLARWTGFIQGVMVARGWLNVDEERDRTRPIFNEPT